MTARRPYLEARRRATDPPNDRAMSRLLITFGIVLVVAGLLWPWLDKLGLGRLPGDIVVEREGFRFYAPLATSLLVSVVISLVLWWLGR